MAAKENKVWRYGESYMWISCEQSTTFQPVYIHPAARRIGDLLLYTTGPSKRRAGDTRGCRRVWRLARGGVPGFGKQSAPRLQGY